MKGFTNGGNTCYFNVSLKSLLIACPELKNYEYSGPCEFTEMFFRLIKAIENPDVKIIDPRPLLELFSAHVIVLQMQLKQLNRIPQLVMDPF